MIINLIKFIHVLLALSLLGLTGYCLTITNAHQTKKFIFLNNKLIIISVFALITGTLLVYPKHFTFHTPWIQAAYILLLFYILTIKLCMLFFKKITYPSMWRFIYTVLIMILIIIIHDAVTKKTALSMYTIIKKSLI